jgi:hypothetical protein
MAGSCGSPSICRRIGSDRVAERGYRTDYATGQFGKNHLGDRDKHLPTAHGFDEFFGNLYHVNAENVSTVNAYRVLSVCAACLSPCLDENQPRSINEGGGHVVAGSSPKGSWPSHASRTTNG